MDFTDERNSGKGGRASNNNFKKSVIFRLNNILDSIVNDWQVIEELKTKSADFAFNFNI